MASLNVPNFGKVLICPYNISHHISVTGMPSHLIKCRRQHRNAKIAICLFNRTHCVPEQELAFHMKNCPDRAMMETYQYVTSTNGNMSDLALDAAINGTKGKPDDYQPSQTGNDDENWDDMNAKPYNPVAYCETHAVIRKATHKTAAEKRQFYEDEKHRISQLRKRNL
ncbi:gametocyte-specific factor 1 homolog [Anopheles nili]|uniref:gametocyte-specific factor 1 homolog n=1 Tax=Anopheles nili TaxID=185578 RepID=UPI00237B974E|nr:gametocyte-specific factor 1 homolog [Anopheles nili]